jgi:hypothetical protein
MAKAVERLSNIEEIMDERSRKHDDDEMERAGVTDEEPEDQGA